MEHPLKAELPIEVTELGIVIEGSEEQPLNMLVPIDVIDSEIVRSVRVVFPLKGEFP